MKIMPTIYKYMKPFFKEKGYLYKHGSFYKIKNNIAYCIYFGRPSEMVYVHLYILPLYMQGDSHHITYGNRICSMYREQLPEINGSSNEEDIAAWCSILQGILVDDIFIFFEQISSPEKLLDYIDNNPKRIRQYLFCGDYFLKLICVYTCLYLHKYDRLPKEIDQCCYALAHHPFVATLKKRKYEEITQIEQVSRYGDAYVDEFFRQVVDKSMSVCF